MNITAEKALAVAKKRLGSDNITLSETDRAFIAAVDRGRGEEMPGEMPISINKRTGAVKEVLLPSEEGFKIIDAAKPVRMRKRK